MPSKTDSENTPLTFDLKDDLLAKLESLRSSSGASTKSEVIRHAISVFDYTTYKPDNQGHRQISVRLPPKLKASLLKAAKQKDVSVGELLRVALESLPAGGAGLKAKVADKKPAAKGKKK